MAKAVVGTGELGEELGEELPKPKTGVFKAGAEKPGLAGWIIVIQLVSIVCLPGYVADSGRLLRGTSAMELINICCFFSSAFLSTTFLRI